MTTVTRSEMTNSRKRTSSSVFRYSHLETFHVTNGSNSLRKPINWRQKQRRTKLIIFFILNQFIFLAYEADLLHTHTNSNGLTKVQ